MNFLADEFFGNFVDAISPSIPVNVGKNDNEYVIQTTISAKQYASVEIEDGRLRICSKYPSSEDGHDIVREIRNGCRTFQFHDAIMDDAKAEMVNNLLRITIPKRHVPNSRQIF
eukprot:NODE_292_length_11597_cov_0.265177.p7 type:complete len:114 gc:universal NODE_292_length_11597_cov_0.265177:9988-9647(-)